MSRIRQFGKRRRRGTIYVLVLSVTLILSAIGMAALMIARLQLRAVTGAQEMMEARLLAQSAAEVGLSVVLTDPNWRATFTNNQEMPSTPFALGGGTIAWKLVDDDGDLADDDTDYVRLVGIGRVGEAAYMKSALLEPAGTGLTCLEVSMHSQESTLIGNSTLQSDQTISANHDVIAWSSTINADVEAVYAVDGDTYNGNTTLGITPRQVPDVSKIYDFYLAKGTHINVTDLPTWAGDPVIQNVLLSPSNNPFGSRQTNPLGIYVIDLKGDVLWIQRCRIVGTLVLLNPGRVELYNEVLCEPAVPNYPTMLVAGDLVVQLVMSETVDENVVGVNLNPTGTPYNGAEDSDLTDSYPVIAMGLIYASGTIDMWSGHPAFDGVVVAGGTINVNVDLDLTYRDTFFNSPPPGFSGGGACRLQPGSWRREPTN